MIVSSLAADGPSSCELSSSSVPLLFLYNVCRYLFNGCHLIVTSNLQFSMPIAPTPAVPPSSSPVLDLRLSELEFSEETMEVQFRVQWNPPTTPNGQITHYLACLGGRKIPNFEQGPGDVKDGNDTTCQNIDKVRYPWQMSDCLDACLVLCTGEEILCLDD